MLRQWLARGRAYAGRYNKVRPTFAGWWYLLMLLGVTVGALNTGNNLVYVVLAALLALLVVNNLLAEWNLRGLEVTRRLPGELYALRPATGHLRLTNPRRWGDALGVEVEERDGGRASACFAEVPARGTVEVGATWRFPHRGVARFATLRIASTYPFGLTRRYRDLELPAEVLVYPTPEREPPPVAAAGDGPGIATRGGADATGEFLGLRAYQPGEPVRRIHWPLSARAGEPLIVVRAGEAGSEVVIELDARGGTDARERAIGRACGRVLWHSARGDAIGLHAGSVKIAAAAGTSHRRRLLTVLAELP